MLLPFEIVGTVRDGSGTLARMNV